MNKIIETPRQRHIILKEDRPLIMGILNFTPDSFSENGEFFDVDKACAHCQNLIFAGADIIDLGLESTRPNAIKVEEDEELRRLDEILPMIRRSCIHNTLLSVDTYKPSVAEYAIKNGADIINCVFGGAFEEEIDEVAMYEVVAKYNCPIVITHNKEVESVAEIISDLGSMANLAIASGVNKDNIIIDYGFGFNKTMAQNLDMQREIESFKSLAYPLLIGVSRKSTLRDIVGDNRRDLDDATLAFFAHAFTKKALSIFRTHNVAKAKICRDCIMKINEPNRELYFEIM